MINSFVNLAGKIQTFFLKLLRVSLLLFTFNSMTMASVAIKHPLYGIIIPTQYETHHLQQAIQHPKTVLINGVTYYTGTLHDKNIVFVISGLGKVNAAAITSRLIENFHPELILLSGSAGSVDFNLKIGDVIIGESVIDIDLGQYTEKGVSFLDQQYLMNPQANRPLPLGFKLDERLLARIKVWQKKTKPSIKLGIIATTDSLPNPKKQIDLLMMNKVNVVEMEGSAVMQTCWLFNTPCIVVRGVSNNANTSIASSDIELAANNAAKIVIDLIQHLS